MSRFEKCPRCKEFCWDRACRCELFFVAQGDKNGVGDGDWLERYGINAETVAKNYGERLDENGDYLIVSGNEEEIWVKDCSDTITKWIVSGEAVPTYYATKKTEE